MVRFYLFWLAALLGRRLGYAWVNSSLRASDHAYARFALVERCRAKEPNVRLPDRSHPERRLSRPANSGRTRWLQLYITRRYDLAALSNTRRAMGYVWFRPLGWLFRPVSWQGYLALSIALGFCVHAFIAIDQHSHSVSDTLYGVVPYVASAFLLLNWLASKTSAT